MRMSLEQKYNFYLEQLKTVQDSSGFIYSDECDSLLFSSLVGCIPGVNFDAWAAFDKSTNMWQRRPCSKPCYPEHSKSTISRDMLIGLCFYAYHHNRLDILEQVISYALTHCFVMGKGPLSRTFMTPGLLSTYAWASYRLGGPSRWWLRYLPHVESKAVTGFQAHLSVLHIILRNRLTGKEDNKYDILKHHAEREPNNALFQYAVGNYTQAESILSNEQLFPFNRLPTNHDRKANWLWQRDEGDDWDVGSGEKKIFSGGDFLFVYALIKDLF